MLKAEIEWLELKSDESVGVLRGGPEYQKFGDPYAFSCTVLRRGDHVTLMGASGVLSTGALREIRAHFKAQGIKSVYWQRRKSDRSKDVDEMV